MRMRQIGKKSNTNGTVEIWALGLPPAGSRTVQVNFSSAPNRNSAAYAVTVNGGDPYDVARYPAFGGNGTAALNNGVAPSVAGGLSFDVYMSEISSASVVSTLQTKQFNVALNGGLAFGSTSPAADGLTALGWTFSGNSTYVYAAGSFLPAPEPRVSNRVVTAGAGNTIAVPVGSLTMAGFAPTIAQSANQVIAVPSGSLTLTGNAPTVVQSANQVVAVPTGSLTLTGFAPTISSSASQTIPVPAASLTLTGYTPTVVNPQGVAVPAGSLTLTGFAPTIAVNQTIQVPAGSLTLTGNAPSVVATASNYLSIAAASLTLTAYAPAILGVQAADAGGGGRPWRRFEDLFGPRRQPFAAPKKSATRKARAADRARIDAEFEHAALLADAQQDEEAAAQFERLRQDYATASAQLREHILQQARELERQQIERQRQALALAEQQRLNNVQQQRDRLKRAAALLMMMH